MNYIVQAIDGLLYVNPLIYRPRLDAYFSIYDNFPSIVVERFKSSTKGSTKRRATAAKKPLGLTGTVEDILTSTKTSFPPNFSGLVDVDVWSIKLKKPIPIPTKFDHVAITAGLDLQHVWNIDVPREEIEAALNEGKITRQLAVFICGQSASIGHVDYNVEPVINWLKKNLPKGELPEKVRLSR